jgi:hypothetical protein
MCFVHEDVQTPYYNENFYRIGVERDFLRFFAYSSTYTCHT